MRALGVEPTNIAKIARRENDIDTIQSFFTEALAKEIVTQHGHAKVVTATNVFAHMAPLGEVVRGIIALLDKDGIFVTESHYLMDVISGGQYDTVYHEHIRTYSLKSLVALLSNMDYPFFTFSGLIAMAETSGPTSVATASMPQPDRLTISLGGASVRALRRRGLRRFRRPRARVPCLIDGVRLQGTRQRRTFRRKLLSRSLLYTAEFLRHES